MAVLVRSGLPCSGRGLRDETRRDFHGAGREAKEFQIGLCQCFGHGVVGKGINTVRGPKVETRDAAYLQHFFAFSCSATISFARVTSWGLNSAKRRAWRADSPSQVRSPHSVIRPERMRTRSSEDR